MAAGAGVSVVGGLDTTATTNGAGDGPTERRADAVGPYFAFGPSRLEVPSEGAPYALAAHWSQPRPFFRLSRFGEPFLELLTFETAGRSGRRPEMQQSQINRAARYRKRAEETRSEAENMNDPGSRAAMLEVAETWERLADQQEAQDLRPTEHSQPRPRVP